MNQNEDTSKYSKVQKKNEAQDNLTEEPSTNKEPEWKEYQKMPRKEKRKYYKCGERGYVPIEKIKTWPEFYQSNGDHFSKISQKISHSREKRQTDSKIYPVDEKINDKLSLWEGDITELEIDAIVNAANRSLGGGGGVDGCIHRAAGHTLVEECRLLNGCDTGDAKITSGHKLPARYVIHTVGPIGKDEKALENCYKNCLRVAKEKEVRTLAFCCVSTGIYGYPNRDAAEVALKTTREWLEDESNANAVDRIIFCLFLEKDLNIYKTLMLKYFPPEEFKKTTETSEEIPNTYSNSKEPFPKKKKLDNNDHDEKKGQQDVKKKEEETQAKHKQNTEENKRNVEMKEEETKANQDAEGKTQDEKMQEEDDKMEVDEDNLSKQEIDGDKKIMEIKEQQTNETVEIQHTVV